MVLCMDVRFAMSNSFPGEESPFELAKKVMTMFVQRQVRFRLVLSLYVTHGLTACCFHLIMQDTSLSMFSTLSVLGNLRSYS